MVVTVWSSVDEFQALAMRLAARVLLPGTRMTVKTFPCGHFFSFYDSKLVPNYIIPTAHCTGQSDEFLVNLEVHVTFLKLRFTNKRLCKALFV